MLKHSLRLLSKSCYAYSVILRKESSAAAVEKWNLITAVCLERKPIVTPSMNELETKFSKYLSEVEYERSLKSDHEVKHEKEMHQLELLKKGDLDVEIELVLKNTAQDFADASAEELAHFKPADRITEDDKKNNVKSLNRKLANHLVLVTSQKIGNKKYFMLPQGLRKDGESLKQTAQRVLKEHCGSEIKAQFYGNAPCGFYKYNYPKGVRIENGAKGAKIFFYFARHQSGQLPEKGTDFKWLDRKELHDILPPDYRDKVSLFLIDED